MKDITATAEAGGHHAYSTGEGQERALQADQKTT
jgi:hypothetical protein